MNSLSSSSSITGNCSVPGQNFPGTIYSREPFDSGTAVPGNHSVPGQRFPGTIYSQEPFDSRTTVPVSTTASMLHDDELCGQLPRLYIQLEHRYSA